MNWWLVSCVGSALIAVGLGAILFACWIADPSDDDERLLEGDCPWPLRHHELAARPDWVAKFKSLHSTDVTDGSR